MPLALAVQCMVRRNFKLNSEVRLPVALPLAASGTGTASGSATGSALAADSEWQPEALRVLALYS